MIKKIVVGDEPKDVVEEINCCADTRSVGRSRKSVQGVQNIERAIYIVFIYLRYRMT